MSAYICVPSGISRCCVHIFSMINVVHVVMSIRSFVMLEANMLRHSALTWYNGI
ncbi:uncharacterized protein P174DRAFT_436487 [Aspergillus novofumigatus IBT 16806]|uniref:Uncharacterized protein n=1 Tax=Aspergillus novofumigatus (strain IBT 16806) TaxID=1392255 RepID=A0A2I1CKH2_ASPN1|nr:uncharacterized protein P174DRAFT_436487 [Aspergillus novofumigatus IBT 16806]PKX98098.1 hypothetical protein P174DRAFT_436487 [Aspergillus novofumigatus IBT 16806]